MGSLHSFNEEDIGSMPGLGRFPCRRKWQPIPVFLPGKSHGERNPAGYGPWIVAHQALSMGFSKQEYWSGLPFPFPGDPPGPGVKSMSPALAGGFFTTEPPGEP